MPTTTVLGPSSPGGGLTVGIARTKVFSGIAFAVLFTLGLVLVNQIPRLDSPDSTYTAFYTTGSGGVLVTVGLYLVPLVYPAWVLVLSFALVRSVRTRAGPAPAVEVLKE